MAESSDGVQMVTAEGVKEEIAELTAVSEDDDSTRRAEIEALKRRIAELFLECEGNAYAGELMGRAFTPSLPVADASVSTFRTMKASPDSA